MAKTKKNSAVWMQLSVVALGILVTPVALHAASILALSGPDGLMLLFPFVQILKSPVLRLSFDLANPVAQWIMYLQFPVYGVLLALISRSKGAWAALGVVVLIHAIGIGLVYMLMYLQNPHLRFS
jgi:hypothetical protein